MKGYWESHPNGRAELLRLLTREGKWLAWKDEEADPKDPSSQGVAGCHSRVEEALLAALNSTNVVVLLGSGASFSAKNDAGPTAPGMDDLWHAVRSNVVEEF